MLIKDYYTILETQPSADPDEIKKSYRRLAHLYHPDKNEGNPYAAAKFSEIKEAYEVLINPSKKEMYLQQRWYNQSIGFKRTQQVITPESVLKQALELEKYVSTLDIHRLDTEGLFEYIKKIIDNETIDKLSQFDEPSIKSEIISLLLPPARLLPLDKFLQLKSYFLKVSYNPETISRIEKGEKSIRKNEWVAKYQPLILFGLVLIICLIIYFLSK